MIFLVLIASMGLVQGSSHAGSGADSTNGNLIPEPSLRDYVRAERTPGFSPVTDVRDENGAPVSRE
ncbi:MAG: hypothetical protein EBX52_00680 [Proteobacteria bacterium]|nr:hypothetical protein [Pseudomonadota bacterium]